MKKYHLKSKVDMSHYLAKRYSIDFVLEGPCTKNDVREIIIAEMKHYKGEIFHRSHLTEERWGNLPPQVIWLGFFANENDTLYCAHALWIDEKLPLPHCPVRLTDSVGNPDTEIYQGIEIQWGRLE